MGTCEECGGELGDTLGCPTCGAAVRGEASMMMPLAALRPEAEPPLPADHELLRSIRTPVPGVEPQTRIERAVATPSRPMPVPHSSPRLDPLEIHPLSRVGPSPLLAAPLDPLPEPAPELAHAVPSLTGSSRRGLLAVLLLLAIGATVGWLLSRDPPPTADEVRARGMQQHAP